jgi:DNA-binding HxlR family transcriptional regulator
MGLGTGYAQQDCSIARALEIVGERWTMLVLRDCFYGVRRFGDLLGHLDISRAVLTERLATLVHSGLLERRSDGGHPEYVLTDAGIAFWPTLYNLSRWGERHAGGGGRTRTFSHVDCGGVVDDLGRCPACGATPPAAELIIDLGQPASGSGRTDPVSVALRRPHRLLQPLL